MNEIREVKKFFNQDFLNKGYQKHQKRSRDLIYKYQKILPPLDLIERYEEYSPGFTKQFIEQMQKERESEHMIRTQKILGNTSHVKQIFQLMIMISVSLLINITIFCFMNNKIVEALTIIIFSVISLLCYLLVLTSQSSKKRKKKDYSYRKKKKFFKV